MTAQISSFSRIDSHAGMAESHGVPSRGRPGPPFTMRQNTKLSVSCGRAPELVKSAGTGLKACAKWPWPSSRSPWQGTQLRT